MTLLQAIIKRIAPCEHKWEQIGEGRGAWHSWTFRCTKCCKSKIIINK